MRPAPLVVILASLLLLQTAMATTYYERSPEEMALAADMIFVGTVDSLRQAGTAETPWTVVTFAVEEWLALEGEAIDRSDPPDDLPRTTELEFLGGAGGAGESLTVSGLPQFRERQRVLIFAYEDDGLASPIVGVSQGAWTLDARGARNTQGSYVRVPAAGRLVTDTTGSGVEELLSAISELLAEDTLPEPLESGEPAVEGDAGEPVGEGDAAEPVDEGDAGEPVDEGGTADQADPKEETEGATEEAAEEPPLTDPPAEGQDPEDVDTEEAETEEPETAEPDTADDPAGQQAQSQAPIVVRYSVDESGGPLLLSSAVASAAQAWSAAAPEAVTFQAADGQTAEADGATSSVHRIAYGDVGLFGPDALSFTLLHPGSSATEVLVSPTAGDMLTPVLLHELGVLAGLPEGGEGVMASAVPAGVAAPTPVDVEALRQLRVFAPEDINRDGVVDFYDLAELAQAYGSRGVNLAADLNGDGVVDDADLEALRRAYRFSPPAERPPD